jgi:hypothetical protein
MIKLAENNPQPNGVNQPPLQQCSVRCWTCLYCDKESVLKDDKWVLTKTGYCLAEKSAINGENDFYKKVYINTIYKECSPFKPCSFVPY